MLLLPWLRRSAALLALLPGPQPLPAPPTLAQVRQAFTTAHPAASFACPDGTPLLTLTRAQPLLACLVGDDELTLYDGHRTTALTLVSHAGSYRKFDVQLAGRDVGSLLLCGDDAQGEVACADLLLRGAGATIPGAGEETRLLSIDDSLTFFSGIRHALAGPAKPGAAVRALNDAGYLLQRAGYPRAALQLLTRVVQHAPGRAVAYLNRGDAYWQLDRPAAAQADYRRYWQLLRTQRQDTTRVPAYVRLALRLPLPGGAGK